MLQSIEQGKVGSGKVVLDSTEKGFSISSALSLLAEKVSQFRAYLVAIFSSLFPTTDAKDDAKDETSTIFFDMSEEEGEMDEMIIMPDGPMEKAPAVNETDEEETTITWNFGLDIPRQYVMQRVAETRASMGAVDKYIELLAAAQKDYY